MCSPFTPQVWFSCHVLFFFALTTSCLLSAGSALVVASVTSCIWSPSRVNWGESSMGVGGRGTTISVTFTFKSLKWTCLCSCFIAIHNYSFFASTAVIGLGLDRGRDDLAQETEAEEVAVTTRDVAPETENVQAVSELLVMNPCPSLPLSIPSLFFFFFFKVCTLPNPL